MKKRIKAYFDSQTPSDELRRKVDDNIPHEIITATHAPQRRLLPRFAAIMVSIALIGATVFFINEVFNDGGTGIGGDVIVPPVQTPEPDYGDPDYGNEPPLEIGDDTTPYRQEKYNPDEEHILLGSVIRVGDGNVFGLSLLIGGEYGTWVAIDYVTVRSGDAVPLAEIKHEDIIGEVVRFIYDGVVLLSIPGQTNAYSAEVITEEELVLIPIEVSATEITFAIENRTPRQYTYNKAFYLMRQEGGELVRVGEPGAFTDIGYDLWPYWRETITLDLERLYGELPPGEYLLRFPMTYIREPGNLDRLAVGFWFTVE